jgi:glycosyltransferase involved in cell wall biosynthesis
MADYHIIPDGIEVAQFQAVRRVRAAERPTILFLGRLEPRKGAAVLLAALPRLRQLASAAGDPLPRIVIAGAGPEMAARQQAVGRQAQITDPESAACRAMPIGHRATLRKLGHTPVRVFVGGVLGILVNVLLN